MMIFWSFTAMDTGLTEEKEGEFIPYLGTEEITFLKTLRFSKRRKEWLASRIAMKRLLCSVEGGFAQYEMQAKQILKGQSGAPYILLDGNQHPATQISISHSNGYVLCACSRENIRLGADAERIETRSQEFVQDFFTQEEIRQIGDSAVLATLAWSAKEAILKALSIGLKVDTRSISVDVQTPGPSIDGWNPIGFSASIVGDQETLRLFWRREGDFILTICIEERESLNFSRVR